MKLFLITSTLSWLLLSACAPQNIESNPSEHHAPPKPAQVITSSEDVSIKALPPNQDWVGTYQRLVPCHDCEGIAVLLRLKADGHYVLRLRHLPQDEEDQKFTGQIQWLNQEQFQLQKPQDFIFHFYGDHLRHLNSKKEALPESFSLMRVE